MSKNEQLNEISTTCYSVHDLIGVCEARLEGAKHWFNEGKARAKSMIIVTWHNL